MMLGGPIICALVGTAIGLNSVALAVALIGAITHGLTGPDIERRTMPNQGIRHAAVNAGRFALIGGLVLGSISGLCNLVAAVLWFGLAPDTWDWFSSVAGRRAVLGVTRCVCAWCCLHSTFHIALHAVVPWCDSLALCPFP